MSEEFSWRDVSTVAAVFATVAFVGSVLYDLGYLASLGISFSQAPTTLADQTRSALIWSPLIAGSLIGALALNMIFWPKEQRPYDLDRAPDRRVWRTEGVLMLLVGLMLVGNWLWNGETELFSGAAGLGVLWFELVLSAFRRGFMAQAMPLLRNLILWAAPAAFLLFSMGWTDAHRAFHSSHTSALASASGDQLPDVRVLRTYDAGYLYRVADRVQFERWDGATIATHSDRREWYGVFCASRHCEPHVDAPVAAPAGSARHP